LDYLLLGVALGFGSGITPGPLWAMVLKTTVRSDAAAGVCVALAPLLTDAVIIALAVTVLEAFPATALAIIGSTGALFVAYLSFDAFREARTSHLPELSASGASIRRALRDGVVVNALSPHPWFFWVLIGGPYIVTAWEEGALHAAGFLVGFFGLLVGSKVVLAISLSRARRRVSQRAYRGLLAAAAAFLLVASLALLAEFLPQVFH
jgi:threonine/homoserine/homoserine lactone efflux protein